MECGLIINRVPSREGPTEVFVPNVMPSTSELCTTESYETQSQRFECCGRLGVRLEDLRVTAVLWNCSQGKK